MEINDGKMVRFRLVFNDRHLLDKSQRSQGLRRCWFHLQPGIKNIGDLASEIRKCFCLHHRIALFMDDFVLPSFESTCIITDKDIILVKMKDAKHKKTRKHCDDDDSQKCLQVKESHDEEILNSHLESSVHLENLGDVGLTKRKRKCSKKLLDSKDQDDENIHEINFEPNYSSDMRKKGHESSEMIQEEDVAEMIQEEDAVASVVRPGYISFQPQEHATQQEDETQKLLLFDGVILRDKFSQTTDNYQCLKVDGLSNYDGILPLPKPEVMSSTIDLTKPQKHAGKDNWEEASSVKESWNDHNAFTADQSNNWPQWIPNKSSTPLSWSFKQPNTPFAGRGYGRANWDPRRYMNTRLPYRNTSNWNINRGKTTWNPN